MSNSGSPTQMYGAASVLVTLLSGLFQIFHSKAKHATKLRETSLTKDYGRTPKSELKAWASPLKDYFPHINSTIDYFPYINSTIGQ